MSDDSLTALEQFDRWHTWPEWAKDALMVDTEVQFSWGDRLRVLFGRKVTVTSKTFTRVVIGPHEAMSRVHVQPFRRPKSLGMVESRP